MSWETLMKAFPYFFDDQKNIIALPQFQKLQQVLLLR